MSIEVRKADMIVMTSMIELESLFGLLFDEYFNGENQVVSKSSVVTTAVASDKRQQQPDSTSSTSTLATTVTANGNLDLVNSYAIGFHSLISGIEDDIMDPVMQRYQKRLNLTKLDTYWSDLKRREAYTAYSIPRGFIYQKKDKKNRLIWIDKLHKFIDGTLNDVRNALDDRLKGIRMQYLPTTIWRKWDKYRAAAMIQAIDKMLKTRRIMRSLERFVGGRLYEGNFRMLQRTI
nr:hypothetical protein [Tanacetum cinerariifolium]